MQYKKTKLKNGMTVISITGLSTNAVTVTAFIRSGLRFDPINRPGLAHFTEHMLFNGTKSFPTSGAVAKAVEQHGGWHSAFTWIEHQKHMVHLPKDRFAEGARLLIETISQPLIREEEIKKEKGMISQEILRNESDPSKTIWDYVLMPLFFQNTHLARPYLGKIKDVVKISKDDVDNFINKYFTPENTVILVAGDLEPDYIEETIANQSKNFNRKADFKLNTLDIKLNKRVLIYNNPSYYQSSIIVGVKTDSYDSADRHKIEFIQQMIGGGFGSSLIQKLRNKGGLIYDWNSFSDFITESGYSVFNTSCSHENVEKVVDIIVKEYRRIGKGEFSRDDFESTKGFASGVILANMETGRDYVEWYGLQELLCPDQVLSVEEKSKLYKNFSMEEIKETASKYFVDENIFIGVVGRVSEQGFLRYLNL